MGDLTRANSGTLRNTPTFQVLSFWRKPVVDRDSRGSLLREVSLTPSVSLVSAFLTRTRSGFCSTILHTRRPALN